MTLKNIFPTGLCLRLGVLFVAAVVVLAAGVHAATVVSPNGQASVSGNVDNVYPFDIAFFGMTSQRYQQVYLASDFAALASGGEFITEVAFRPNALTGSTFATTLPDVRIDLSTSSAGPGFLSDIFDNNVGANDTIVYGGASGAALSLSSSFTGPAGGPKNFDIIINLTSPFFYNPAAGNLLLDVRNFGGGTTTPLDSEYLAISTSRAFTWGQGVDSASGIADSLGLITQFTTFAAPEPGVMVVFGAGAVLIGLRRRWIRA